MSLSRQRHKLIAIVGPTATGKSNLGIALANQIGGEIVSCDSTAVYRGFDIGTDKVLPKQQQGIPHYLIDVVDPDESYSAARYAREATETINRICMSGLVPILVGGTGLYFRALTRGLFPGPARNNLLRNRLADIANRKGPEWLHQMVARIDPPSGLRIHPQDVKRLVRALEVYFLTKRPLTEHFAETRSPLEHYEILAFALKLEQRIISSRIAERVDRQFSRGLVSEVRSLLKQGVSEDAHPFTGLVYRQVLDHLKGIRNESETRELIIKENEKYARRQLVWFRKEPNLQWINLSGEDPEAIKIVLNRIT